jgi:hypothetical protein
MNLKAIFVWSLTVLPLCTVMAQSRYNPEISVVGDMRVYSHNDTTRPDEKEKMNIASPSMEIVAAGYLNPYARADAVISWEGGNNAEVEEVYATILRGLPFGVNLRAGKYLLEFGRLNPVHEHAWSFMERPLPHEAFFGDEGLSDMTIRASFLLPTGNAYTELMGGVLKGDALSGQHLYGQEGDEEEEPAESERVNPGFLGRLATSLAVSEHAELALGISVVNSVYERNVDTLDGSANELRAWVGGADIKYKNKPSRYTTLQIEAEGLLNRQETEDGDGVTSYGGYGYVDYRFRQKYNAGGIFEYISQKNPEEDEDTGTAENKTWRAGLFVGFAPIEETSLLRLAGHWTEPDEGDGFWEISLQLVFSLGPHQPHNF